MKILLTNDDGVNAKGIRTLYEALSPNYDVILVAPSKEKNATSHSITLRRPLKVKELSPDIISVNGTPTDCVMLAIYNFTKEIPDLLISGINHGPNLGDDVAYSGTVGAALEGAMLGIPSLAISFTDEKEGIISKHYFKQGKEVVLSLVSLIEKNGFPPNIFLNINIPYNPDGVKITKLGRRIYNNVVKSRGRGIYVIAGTPGETEGETGTDISAIEKGYVSITPLKIDITAYETVKTFKDWEKLIRV